MRSDNSDFSTTERTSSLDSFKSAGRLPTFGASLHPPRTSSLDSFKSASKLLTFGASLSPSSCETITSSLDSVFRSLIVGAWPRHVSSERRVCVLFVLHLGQNPRANTERKTQRDRDKVRVKVKETMRCTNCT